MERIRIVIEIDTKQSRKMINYNVKRAAEGIVANLNAELIYLATEIAPSQETRQRDILEEKA